MFRDLIILKASASPAPTPTPGTYPLRDEPVNTDTPYSDETLTPFTPDSRFVIVGADTIDGDVRAGVYSILDLSNLTLVSESSTSDTTVSGGYNITWAVNSQNLSCSVGTNNEKMWLNILRPIQNRNIRISATINGNGVSNKTIYFDVNCTYAPANFVIRNINDWLLLKTAIAEGKESEYYLNAIAGCANKRFRLDCDLTFNYNVADYSVGRYNATTRGGTYFGGTFDGADYCITISGTHPNNQSTDRNGGVFNYIYNARILNFSVNGSITSPQAGGSIIGAHRAVCRFERLYSNCNVTVTSGAACGAIGISYASKSRSPETEVIPDFSPILKDIIFVGSVTSDRHAGMISSDCCKNAQRLIAIGSARSQNTSNPVKSGITLDDGDRVGEQNFFVRNMFSKAKLYNGMTEARDCVQVQGYIGKADVRNILSMNMAANACIISHHNSATVTYDNLFYTNDSSTSNNTWIKVKGTKKTFTEACNNNLFAGNNNWLKGSVGTNIINNQYATNPYVLRAAKDENYYGDNI